MALQQRHHGSDAHAGSDAVSAGRRVQRHAQHLVGAQLRPVQRTQRDPAAVHCYRQVCQALLCLQAHGQQLGFGLGTSVRPCACTPARCRDQLTRCEPHGLGVCCSCPCCTGLAHFLAHCSQPTPTSSSQRPTGLAQWRWLLPYVVWASAATSVAMRMRWTALWLVWVAAPIVGAILGGTISALAWQAVQKGIPGPASLWTWTDRFKNDGLLAGRQAVGCMHSRVCRRPPLSGLWLHLTDIQAWLPPHMHPALMACASLCCHCRRAYRPGRCGVQRPVHAHRVGILQ